MASELNVGSLVVGGGVAGNKLAVHQTDAGLNSYVHITHADTGSAVSDGLSVGLDDTGLNAAIRLREAGTLTLYTSNEPRLSIDNAGLAAFSNEITCTGINISNQTNAAGRTSGKLDHYEEGNFTATITPQGGGTVTVSYGLSRYTRVGRLVTLTSLIIIGSVSTSPAPTGTMVLGGFPFAVNAHTDGNYAGDSAGAIHVQNITASIGSGALQCYTIGGTTTAAINTFNGTTQAEISDKLKAGTQIRFTITYTV